MRPFNFAIYFCPARVFFLCNSSKKEPNLPAGRQGKRRAKKSRHCTCQRELPFFTIARLLLLWLHCPFI